jgi:Sec-independent protein secretion pathway component TatC
MIENLAVMCMLTAALSLLFAVAIGIAWLIETTDPRPPKAGMMRELYRGPK